MRGLLNRVLQKARNNMNEVKFDGILLAVVLSFFILVLGGNIIRVFTNGQSNYATFLEEQEELYRLQDRNKSLSEEFEYVSSDEYKALLLRDTQNLARPEEKLFNTKEAPNFLVETPEFLDVSEKSDYTSWWNFIISF